MPNKRFNKQVPGYGYKHGGPVKAKAHGGRINTSRENRLEELGRVDAERAGTGRGRRNLSDEKKRIVRELRGR